MTLKLKSLDPNLIHPYWEHVICLHCCKWFDDPHFAPCGHTLCKLCWKQHRTCPICCVRIVIEKLKPNERIQKLTGNVKEVVKEYENLNNVNYHEAMNVLYSSPKKSSQNDFSQSLQDSEQNSQETPVKVQISTTKVQMHRNNHGTNVLSKAGRNVPSQKDDWDKIEEISDTEEQHSKIQLLDDNVYTTSNLRRSSRNRELPNNVDHKSNEINQDIPNNSNMENNKSIQSKKDKSKHTWINFNKTKKEYCKLNKENRSKLNNSIKMCKKTYGNDNTKNKVFSNPAAHDNNKNLNKAKHINISKDNHSLQLCQVDNLAGNEFTNNSELSINKPQKNDANAEPNTTTNNCQKLAADTRRDIAKVPFFKKSALYFKTINNPIATLLNNNNSETNNDNIKIIIKYGSNTVANISVNKKDNISLDFTHKDKEIQTIQTFSTSKNFVDQSVQTEDIQIIPSNNIGNIIKDTNSADTDALEIFSCRSEKQKDLTVIMECSEENISETYNLNKADNEAQVVDDDLNMFDIGPTEECYVQPLIDSKRIHSKILTPSRGPKRTQSPALENKDVVDISHEKGPPKKKLKTLLSQDMGSEVMQNKTSSDIFHEEQSNKPVQKKQYVPGPDTQARIDTILTPGICRDLAASEDMLTGDNAPEPIVCTPVESNSCEDVIEETPQKNISSLKSMSRSKTGAVNITSKNTTNIDTNNIQGNKTSETPVTVFTNFANNITHKSTPFARKSLDFNKKNLVDIEPTLDEGTLKINDDDHDQTLCPTLSLISKTTQEKEVLAKVFEKSMEKTQAKRDFCVACSGLNDYQINNIQRVCGNRGWKFVTDYVNEITHLIVATDEENKTQRTVKYMRALAAGKWIISYGWIEMCLKNEDVVKEGPFEVLDMSGYSGPKKARMSKRDLFKGIVFYCMPPYGVLNAESLEKMLEASGGKVVRDIEQVKATGGGPPALLLAEPEQTEEDTFLELAIHKSVVPVNFEWAVNCLGRYSLSPIDDLLLCPKSMVADAISHWPVALVLPY